MMKTRRPPPLPTPIEMGFPDKFREYYDDQIEAIDKIVANGRRFTALAMPTGSGKSLTGVTAAMLHPKVRRGIYLTSTKGLQDQLAQDFEPIGMRDLRGARNYPCLMVEPQARLGERFHAGCDEGPCHAEIWCSKAPDPKDPTLQPLCYYYDAVWQARHADLISTNYAMFFASQEYAQGLGDLDLLVLDEAHDATTELESFLVIELSYSDARSVSTKKMARIKTAVEWKDWAKKSIPNVNRSLKTTGTHTARDVQDRLHLKTLLKKVERLSEIDPEQWVIEDDGVRLRFSPLKVAPYAEQYLFRGIKHVVLMSATLTHKTLGDLGLKRDDYVFWEAPSRFPLGRRPIYSIETTPATRVTYRMDEETKFFWIRRMDRLIEPRRRLGWKGIIHAVSYQRAMEIVARSENKDIMLLHAAGGTREAIEKFKQANGPCILVSPAIVTGYDFPDDECRFQIIAKVPMPDMTGPIMKARAAIDKQYAGYLAMQKLVQACGRGMRGPNDWCETFIIDDTFSDWFYRVNARHAPRWFQDAIERVEFFPEPLVVLDDAA